MKNSIHDVWAIDESGLLIQQALDVKSTHTTCISLYLSFINRLKHQIPNIEQYFDKYELINLERYEKLYEENNMNNSQQQIYSDTDDHVLTNMLQGENVVDINQLLSSLAVSNYPFANDCMIDIMSIEKAKCTVYHSPIRIGGEDTPQHDCLEVSESFSDIDVPDQPSPKSDLVTTLGKDDQVMILESNGISQENTKENSVDNQNIERDINIIDTQTEMQTTDIIKTHVYFMDSDELSHIEISEVAYPDNEVDRKINADDIDGNDTCCDTICYYCGVF